MIGARAAPGAATPGSFPTGWYGKIPATGDFIARRIPASFSQSWDRWLQAAVEGSRTRLGARWRDSFLSMPAWRFILGPGVLTQNAWAGLMVPSVDAVGRYFPLTIAAALPAASVDQAATLLAAAAWFDQIEAVALKAIAPGTDAAAIDTALAGRPFEAGWLQLPRAGDEILPIRDAKPQMLWVPLLARTPTESLPASLLELAGRLAEPCSAWLAEESEVFGRCLLLCEALPAAELYCAMMDGRWIEHGWGRRKIGA